MTLGPLIPNKFLRQKDKTKILAQIISQHNLLTAIYGIGETTISIERELHKWQNTYRARRCQPSYSIPLRI